MTSPPSSAQQTVAAGVKELVAPLRRQGNVLHPPANLYVDLGYLRGQRLHWDEQARQAGREDARHRLNIYPVIDAARRRFDVRVVHVYDAVPADGTPAGNAAWHQALRVHPHVQLHLRPSLYPPDYEQKEVDVQLAVDMVRDADSDVRYFVLVSGDHDFVPAIDAVRAKGVQVTVAAFLGSHAHKLLRVAANDTIDLDDEPIVILRWIPGLGP